MKTICSALEISRSTYHRLTTAVAETTAPKEPDEDQQADKALVETIKQIAADHPFWGYRRVTAWLRKHCGYKVNRKKVYHLMKENGLTQKTAKRKPVRPLKAKPRASKPDEIWGIDMTKFIVEGLGWVYLVLVLDWFTKRIVSWGVSLRARAAEWRAVLNEAVLNRFPQGAQGQGLKLVSDNGSQPTATSFIQDCKTLGIQQIFTTYDNPKGNADTERVMRTVKEEILWPNEWRSQKEAEDALRAGIAFYNSQYPHSSLGYLSPAEFESKYQKETLEPAA